MSRRIKSWGYSLGMTKKSPIFVCYLELLSAHGYSPGKRLSRV